jgi:hypothetical protein
MHWEEIRLFTGDDNDLPDFDTCIYTCLRKYIVLMLENQKKYKLFWNLCNEFMFFFFKNKHSHILYKNDEIVGKIKFKEWKYLLKWRY